MIFFYLKSIKAHVRYRAFATFQIELYHVVYYDSKCFTKFHKDCMFEEKNYFTFKTSYDICFYLKKVLGPMFDTELLQHSKLNCTM